MGKRGTTPIREGGRPVKPIDWEKADQLLEAGCCGTEVAAYFGIHQNTFYERVQSEKGCGFTQYQSEKRKKGESLLRAAQFKNALKGNTSMQIWLGKNRLAQRDRPKEEDEKDDMLANIARALASLGKVSDSEEPSQPKVEDGKPLLDQEQTRGEDTL